MQQRYSKIGQHSHSYTSKQIKESLALKEVKLEASKTQSVDEVEKLPEGIFDQELDITKGNFSKLTILVEIYIYLNMKIFFFARQVLVKIKFIQTFV